MAVDANTEPQAQQHSTLPTSGAVSKRRFSGGTSGGEEHTTSMTGKPSLPSNTPRGGGGRPRRSTTVKSGTSPAERRKIRRAKSSDDTPAPHKKKKESLSLEASLQSLSAFCIVDDNAGSRLVKGDDEGSCYLSVAELSQSALSINSKCVQEETRNERKLPTRRASMSANDSDRGLKLGLPHHLSKDDGDVAMTRQKKRGGRTDEDNKRRSRSRSKSRARSRTRRSSSRSRKDASSERERSSSAGSKSTNSRRSMPSKDSTRNLKNRESSTRNLKQRESSSRNLKRREESFRTLKKRESSTRSLKRKDSTKCLRRREDSTCCLKRDDSSKRMRGMKDRSLKDNSLKDRSMKDRSSNRDQSMKDGSEDLDSRRRKSLSHRRSRSGERTALTRSRSGSSIRDDDHPRPMRGRRRANIATRQRSPSIHRAPSSGRKSSKSPYRRSASHEDLSISTPPGEATSESRLPRRTHSTSSVRAQRHRSRSRGPGGGVERHRGSSRDSKARRPSRMVMEDRSEPMQKTTTKFPRNASREMSSSEQFRPQRRRRSISRRNTSPPRQRPEITEAPKTPMPTKLNRQQSADLDQSLNSLLSAYNNAPHNNNNGSLSDLGGVLNDSYSTNSDMDSTMNSLLDDSSTTAMQSVATEEQTALSNMMKDTAPLVKKKKKSLASRVIKKTLGTGRSSKDKKKKREEEQEKEREAREFEEKLIAALTRDKPVIPRESTSTNATEDATTGMMDESSQDNHHHHHHHGGKAAKTGISNLARRMGRRISFKVKERPSELNRDPLASTMENNDEPLECDKKLTEDAEGNDTQNDNDETTEGDNNDNEEEKEGDDDDEKDLVPPPALQRSKSTDNAKPFNSSDKNKKVPEYAVTPLPKKSKKFPALARRLTGRKKPKVTAHMEKLNDSFVSIGAADRAILETTETMQKALKEFGLDAHGALDDDEDFELALEDGDDPEFQLNLMKSFAQLDFIGMGLIDSIDEDDAGHDKDDPLAVIQQSAILTNACTADAEQPLSILDTTAGAKPQLVVRRSKGNHPKSSEEVEEEEADRKPRGRKKKPVARVMTDGGPDAGSTGEAFDWEKHAGRKRRSKSLNSLRASAMRQKEQQQQQQQPKQKQRSGLPQNTPRARFPNDVRPRAPSDVPPPSRSPNDVHPTTRRFDDSEESLDASILSESVDEQKEGLSGEREGQSLPAVLQQSQNNRNRRYSGGHVSTPQVEAQ